MSDGTVLAGVWWCSFVLAAAGATQRDVSRALQERGIGYDTNAADRGMIEAMVRAVDGRARILDADGALRIGAGPGVESVEEWAGGILYLKLGGVSSGAAREIAGRVQGWTNDRACGVILDVRGAAGESFAAAEEIAGLFVEPGAVLYAVKDARGTPAETRAARGEGCARGWPLLVLTDGETRDASELLAAVLRGRRGVLLLGARTFGDDSRREKLGLANGEALYIATGHVEVGDRRYRAEGVRPDIAVPAPEPGAAGAAAGEPASGGAVGATNLEARVSGDALLRRSADILLGLKAVSPADGRRP